MDKWIDLIIKNITLITVLVTTTTTLIVTIFKSIGQSKQAYTENIPKNIKIHNEVNLIINMELENLKELLNADRIHLYDFHNGGHYANGRSALKMSCTYEVTRFGIESVQMYLQNLPLSVMSVYISELLGVGEMEVKDIHEIAEFMPAVYQIKTDFNIKAYYDIIINNIENEPIGLLSIQYTKNEYHLDHCDKSSVLKSKLKIENYLESV